MNQFHKVYEIIKPMLPIYAIVFVAYLILVIYCVVDLLKSKNNTKGEKILWLFIIVLIQVFGPIAYLAIGKKRY